jgi:single-strand DNA-binding protein
MPNFASVTLVGHLGRDPETKTVGGDTVTSFSLATNRKRKDSDLSTWWNCACWGKRGAMIGQYLGKGDPILVTGEPCLRHYTTKDGRDGVALEVDVRDWTFVGSKNDAQSAQTPPRAPSAPTPQGQAPAAPYYDPAVAGEDDDIPF